MTVHVDGAATRAWEEDLVEGEPELHAPEEEAIAELDDDEEELAHQLETDELLEQDLGPQELDEALEELEAEEEPEDAGDEELELPAGRAAVVEGDEEAEDELEGEEVEAALDQILAQRLAVVEEEAEESEDARALPAIEGDVVEVLPRQADEFVCQGCFLLRHRELLADPERQLCRDCVS